MLKISRSSANPKEGEMRVAWQVTRKACPGCQRTWRHFETDTGKVPKTLLLESTTVLSTCLSPWRVQTSWTDDRWLKCQHPDRQRQRTAHIWVPSTPNHISNCGHTHTHAYLLHVTSSYLGTIDCCECTAQPVKSDSRLKTLMSLPFLVHSLE